MNRINNKLQSRSTLTEKNPIKKDTKAQQRQRERLKKIFNENVTPQKLQETRKGHFRDKRKWRILKKGTWGKTLRFFLKLFGFGKRIKRWKEEADTLNLEDIAAAYPQNLNFSNIEILEKLLDAGADPKKALIMAVDGNHDKAVDALVKVLAANEADFTAALIMAVDGGHMKAIELLLNDANPDFFIKFFKSVCSKENRWAIDEQVIFDKLFKKIEDLKTRKQLNTQQIGKIVTTGMRIFNTMPIEFQNKFFKFFLSTLDEPNVIGQLKGDILHCAKLFTIAETPSNQENTAEAEKELLQIKDLDLQVEMLRRYAKTQEVLEKIQANISIHQQRIIPKVISYLELRNPNLNKDDITVGVCHGLTFLYCYYQFLGKESEFYDRIYKMLSIDIKQSEGLAEKRYDELSENEMELEHFCNDILYLQGFPTRIQKPPVAVLSFVTDETSIKKLSSQFHFASYFPYDSTTKSYPTLKKTLTQILRTDTNKSKFLLLSKVSHVFGIFYQNDRCYLYDSNEQFKLPSFDFDTLLMTVFFCNR